MDLRLTNEVITFHLVKSHLKLLETTRPHFRLLPKRGKFLKVIWYEWEAGELIVLPLTVPLEITIFTHFEQFFAPPPKFSLKTLEKLAQQQKFA